MKEDYNALRKNGMSADIHFMNVRERPVSIPSVNTIVIKDYLGNPLVVAQVISSGDVYVTTASDPDFNNRLQHMGIGLRTEVKEVII